MNRIGRDPNLAKTFQGSNRAHRSGENREGQRILFDWKEGRPVIERTAVAADLCKRIGRGIMRDAALQSVNASMRAMGN